MKLANKLISTLLSLLILTTCVPTQAFAQKFNFKDIMALVATGEDLGVLSPPELYMTEPYQLVELKGGEDLASLGIDMKKDPVAAMQEGGVAREGDRLVIQKDGTKRLFRPGFDEPKAVAGMDGFYADQRIVVTVKEDVEVAGRTVPAGRMYDITWYPEKVFTASEKLAPASKFSAKIARGFSGHVFSQEQLAKLVEEGSLGKSDLYVNFTRIQAEQAKGGELIGIVKEGYQVPNHIQALPGQMIVLDSKGGKHTMLKSLFDEVYVAAPELGPGWYKPNEGTLKFIKLNRDIAIHQPFGTVEVLQKGDYLGVKPGWIYGMSAREVESHYKTIRVMYQDNLKGMKGFFAKIETKLAQRFPKYSGVFFKKMLANDTDFMLKRLDQRAAKQAEKIADKQAEKAGTKQAEKAAAKKTGLRIFGGLLFGAALYIGISVASSHTNGQAVVASANDDVFAETAAKMKKLRANLERPETDQSIVENMMLFMDPNMRREIMRDPELLEQMSMYSAVVQSEIGDAMADAVVEELGNIYLQGQGQNDVQAQLSRPLARS